MSENHYSCECPLPRGYQICEAHIASSAVDIRSMLPRHQYEYTKPQPLKISKRHTFFLLVTQCSHLPGISLPPLEWGRFLATVTLGFVGVATQFGSFGSSDLNPLVGILLSPTPLLANGKDDHCHQFSLRLRRHLIG